MALKAKKGTAPATGKVKPNRAELLLAQQAEMARDQIPEAHTMEAITGSRSLATEQPAPIDDKPSTQSAPEPEVDEPQRMAVIEPSPGQEPGRRIQIMALAEIQRSPFQPKGRPSGRAIEAIERAVLDTGSLAALLGQEGAVRFNQLTPEARRLAELAYDIQQRGVTDPIEVRSTPDGAIECLRGHRRMAGAKLAGLAEVPILHRGTMSNAQAAATVLSGNLHRENFTTWQEAVLVTQVQEQRRANDQPHDVRSIGGVMGWSHGKVQNLLTIRRILNPEYLAEVGRGQSEAVEDMLSHMTVADLTRVASLDDRTRRTAELHHRMGLTTEASRPTIAKAACALREKRGGGFELVVTKSVETLDRGDASVLFEILERQFLRVRARVDALKAGAGPQ